MAKKPVDDDDVDNDVDDEEIVEMLKDPKAQKAIKLFEHVFDKKVKALQKKHDDNKRADKGFLSYLFEK